MHSNAHRLQCAGNVQIQESLHSNLCLSNFWSQCRAASVPTTPVLRHQVENEAIDESFSVSLPLESHCKIPCNLDRRVVYFAGRLTSAGDVARLALLNWILRQAAASFTGWGVWLAVLKQCFWEDAAASEPTNTRCALVAVGLGELYIPPHASPGLVEQSTNPETPINAANTRDLTKYKILS